MHTSQHGDAPHEATRYESSDGRGTISKLPSGDTQDRAVLDGASESTAAEKDVDNPRRGMSDPGLVRHPETGEKTPTPNEDRDV